VPRPFLQIFIAQFLGGKQLRILIVAAKERAQNFPHLRVGALHAGDKNDLLINERVEVFLLWIQIRAEAHHFLVKKR
jgi:hypothetical protein